MTWRRLKSLLRGLPAEGTALARARGGDAAAWTTQNYILARAADDLAWLRWMFYESNRDQKKTSQMPKPEPIPLPGAEAAGPAGETSSAKARAGKPPRYSTPEEFMAFFGPSKPGQGGGTKLTLVPREEAG